MKVTFLAPARYEFDEAVEYYEEQEAGLGDHFRTEIIKSIKRISSFPAAYTKLSANTRRCLVARFHHAIIYHFDRENEEILIVAVAHTRRRPEYWRSRFRET